MALDACEGAPGRQAGRQAGKVRLLFSWFAAGSIVVPGVSRD